MSPRHRALALLALPDDGSADAFAATLVAEAERAQRTLAADDAQWRILSRCARPPDPRDIYAQILDRGLANGVMLGGFSVALEVSVGAAGDTRALATCFAGLADRLGNEIVRDRSHAVVGTDVVIVDGDGDVHLIYAMRRSAKTTHEEFCRFWANQHAAVATSTPGLAGYRQLHTDLAQSRQAADAAGLVPADIDGVALEWFASLDDFASAVGGPAEFRQRAKSSEQQFNDLDGAQAIVSRAIASSTTARGSRS